MQKARKLFLFFILIIFSSKTFAQDNVRVLLDSVSERSKIKLIDVNLNNDPLKLSGEFNIIKSKRGWSLYTKDLNINCDFGKKIKFQGEIIFDRFKIDLVEANCFLDKLDFVAVTSMDEYLVGVLFGEMPTLWNIEALKAQAVTSRTYAYWKMKVNQNKHYDVHASVADQVYSTGYRLTTRTSEKNLFKIKNIVMKTKNEFLLKEGGITKAYFHADCGGHTTLADQVWGENASSSNIVSSDIYCDQRNSNYWNLNSTLSDIERTIKNKLEIPSNWKLFSIKPVVQNKKSRVNFIDLIFQEGQLKRISGDQLRSILGYGQLKSTNFKLQIFQDNVFFIGKGHGHGVGLCQWGAKAMADQGFDYQQILKHYFPDSVLIAKNMEDLDFGKPN